MDSKRVKFIDITRGIAIICIIIGHLGIYNINKIVFTFHVPIFFLITGYFISDKATVLDFIKKKFRTLIVPYICTCLVMIVMGVLKAYILDGTNAMKNAFLNWGYASLYGAGDSYTEPFYIMSIGAIWFLWATLWGSIFLRISLNLKQEVRIFYVAALFGIGYYSRSLFWFPLSIQAGCCATLFMYIGYIYKNMRITLKSITDEAKEFITVFAVVVWVSFIREFQSFWLVHCDVGRGIADIFGCLCGCYIVFLVARFIEKYIIVLSKGLAFIGKYSLFMLCIHIIELNLFPWWELTDKMIAMGMLPTLQLPIIIVGKLIMDISLTVFCAHCNAVRIIFGMTGIKR